jgi:hypothetical protein
MKEGKNNMPTDELVEKVSVGILFTHVDNVHIHLGITFIIYYRYQEYLPVFF